MIGLEWTDVLDRIGLTQNNFNQIGLDWTELNWIGLELEQTRQDWVRFDEMGLGWI